MATLLLVLLWLVYPSNKLVQSMHAPHPNHGLNTTNVCLEFHSYILFDFLHAILSVDDRFGRYYTFCAVVEGFERQGLDWIHLLVRQQVQDGILIGHNKMCVFLDKLVPSSAQFRPCKFWSQIGITNAHLLNSERRESLDVYISSPLKLYFLATFFYALSLLSPIIIIFFLDSTPCWHQRHTRTHEWRRFHFEIVCHRKIAELWQNEQRSSAKFRFSLLLFITYFKSLSVKNLFRILVTSANVVQSYMF